MANVQSAVRSAGSGRIEVVPGSAVRGPAPGAALGAEIRGVDLARPLDAQTFAAVEAALHRHGVICFRGQAIDDEQQLAFSRLWGGEFNIHPISTYAKKDHPEVYVLSNILDAGGRPVGAAEAAQYWHSDLSYTTHPTRVTILYGAEIPHDEHGQPLGDTEFASTVAAWDALAPAMKARLASMRAGHDAQKKKSSGHFMKPIDDRTKAVLTEVTHPVVRTHPYTQQKCLYLNWGFTTRLVGLPEIESNALLAELFEFMTQRKFIHVHKWQQGDVLLWDNCLTIHQGIGNYRLPQRRLLYRTMIRGSAPY